MTVDEKIALVNESIGLLLQTIRVIHPKQLYRYIPSDSGEDPQGDLTEGKGGPSQLGPLG